MKKDILINCPCDSHKETRYNSVNKEIKAIPKILLIASPNAVGNIKVQCPDNWCRRYNKKNSNNKYNSWYEVEFNGLGGYKITAIPKQEFIIERVPVAILGE